MQRQVPEAAGNYAAGEFSPFMPGPDLAAIDAWSQGGAEQGARLRTLSRHPRIQASSSYIERSPPVLPPDQENCCHVLCTRWRDVGAGRMACQGACSLGVARSGPSVG